MITSTSRIVNGVRVTTLVPQPQKNSKIIIISDRLYCKYFYLRGRIIDKMERLKMELISNKYSFNGVHSEELKFRAI